MHSASHVKHAPAADGRLHFDCQVEHVLLGFIMGEESEQQLTVMHASTLLAIRA